MRVWVRRGADGNIAVAANPRFETTHPDPSEVGSVIGGACVSIVEAVTENQEAETDAQRG